MSTEFDFASFDAEQVDTSNSYEPLPEGVYDAVIDDTEMRPNKRGDGSFLHLAFSVIDGEYEGRKFFTNLNLVNPSQKAEAFAKKDLAKIQKAIGRLRIQSHEDLRNIPLQVRLTIRHDEGYDPQNEVKDYFPSTKFQSAAAAPAPVPAAPAPAPAQQPAPAPAPAPQPASAPAPAAAPAAATVQPRPVAPWKRK